jgi:2-iminobutanoate/2-iminopropanoate deaminase
MVARRPSKQGLMSGAMGTVVNTAPAPAPVGPYSQAIRANGFIFASGQIPIDPSTQELVSGGIAEQTERVLRNVANLLQAGGSGTPKIVRCVVFLKDMADFETMNEVYARFFGSDPPARTTVAAAGLPRDALIEIEATAIESDRPWSSRHFGDHQERST